MVDQVLVTTNVEGQKFVKLRVQPLPSTLQALFGKIPVLAEVVSFTDVQP